MADILVTVDRTDPKNLSVTVAAAPGTDQGSFAQAKPRIQAVLDALGIANVQFVQLTDIEQHAHAHDVIVVTQPQIRHS